MTARLPLRGVDLSAPRLPLPPAVAHYATAVLRLQAGASVTLFDGAGAERQATLQPTPDGWEACPDGPPSAGRAAAPLTLIYGLPKGDKLDLVVRQATELGVQRIVLAAMARSVARLDPAKAARRLERLERIATEAARQAGRADVPALSGPASPAELLRAETPAHAACWLLDPGGATPLALARAAAPLALWVGPEGGFDPSERAAAEAAGWQRVALATPILRTETAAPVACALALARLGFA